MGKSQIFASIQPWYNSAVVRKANHPPSGDGGGGGIFTKVRHLDSSPLGVTVAHGFFKTCFMDTCTPPWGDRLPRISRGSLGTRYLPLALHRTGRYTRGLRYTDESRTVPSTVHKQNIDLRSHGYTHTAQTLLLTHLHFASDREGSSSHTILLTNKDVGQYPLLLSPPFRLGTRTDNEPLTALPHPLPKPPLVLVDFSCLSKWSLNVVECRPWITDDSSMCI